MNMNKKYSSTLGSSNTSNLVPRLVHWQKVLKPLHNYCFQCYLLTQAHTANTHEGYLNKCNSACKTQPLLCYLYPTIYNPKNLSLFTFITLKPTAMQRWGMGNEGLVGLNYATTYHLPQWPTLLSDLILWLPLAVSLSELLANCLVNISENTIVSFSSSKFPL